MIFRVLSMEGENLETNLLRRVPAMFSRPSNVLEILPSQETRFLVREAHCCSAKALSDEIDKRRTEVTVPPAQEGSHNASPEAHGARNDTPTIGEPRSRHRDEAISGFGSRILSRSPRPTGALRWLMKY